MLTIGIAGKGKMVGCAKLDRTDDQDQPAYDPVQVWGVLEEPMLALTSKPLCGSTATGGSRLVRRAGAGATAAPSTRTVYSTQIEEWGSRCNPSKRM